MRTELSQLTAPTSGAAPINPTANPNGNQTADLIRQAGAIFRDVMVRDVVGSTQNNASPPSAQNQTPNAPASVLDLGNCSPSHGSLESLVRAITDLFKVVGDLAKSVFSPAASVPNPAASSPAASNVAAAGAAAASAAAPESSASTSAQPAGTAQDGLNQPVNSAEQTKTSLFSRTINWLQDEKKVQEAVTALSGEYSWFRTLANSVDIPKIANTVGSLLSFIW